jgi:tankyrase
LQILALLQHGADPTIRNSEGKTPFDLADPLTTAQVFTGEYMKNQLLEAARSGNEERYRFGQSNQRQSVKSEGLILLICASCRLLAYLTPFNVSCHALDGRKSTPLHLGKHQIQRFSTRSARKLTF